IVHDQVDSEPGDAYVECMLSPVEATVEDPEDVYYVIEVSSESTSQDEESPPERRKPSTRKRKSTVSGATVITSKVQKISQNARSCIGK
ncbi:unnamed protein product, partial [Nesidiocoris tenuis]